MLEKSWHVLKKKIKITSIIIVLHSLTLINECAVYTHVPASSC